MTSNGRNHENDTSTGGSGAGKLSPFVTACFTLNYLIGTGFLALPWAFQRSGLLLSGLCMILICWIANVSSDYILSAMARCDAIRVQETKLSNKTLQTPVHHDRAPAEGNNILLPQDRSTSTSHHHRLNNLNHPHIDEHTALLLSTADNKSQHLYHQNSTPLPDNKETNSGVYHKTSDEEEQSEAEAVSSTYQKNHHHRPIVVTHAPSGRELLQKAKLSMDCGTEEEQFKLSPEGLLLVSSSKKYDIPEMCEMVLGSKGVFVYGIAVSLDIYGFLWAYTSVFASAMAKALPLVPDSAPVWMVGSYPIYVIIFAFIVVPMSLLELNEQASLQVGLSACRIVMMLCMVLTPLVAMIYSTTAADVDIASEEEDALLMTSTSPVMPHFGDQLGAAGESTSWFNLSNIHQMIPIVVFCVLFHQAVPGLADEVSDKSQLHSIFGLTFVLCGLCYSLIGFVDVLYFGSGILESANLNWKHYHGGTGVYNSSTEAWVGVAWWAKLISFFVVVFPALDVISAFPLNAFVLGNNLLDMTYREKQALSQSSPKHIRRIQHRYRALAALPPIVGAMFIRNLGTITDYSGLSGLAIAFCFPPLLYIKSQRLLEQRYNVPYTKTHYERLGSNSVLFAKGMFMFGIVSIVYCFLLLVLRG